MQNLSLITLTFYLLLAGCIEQSKPVKVQKKPTSTSGLVIPSTNIDRSEIYYSRKNSLWTLNGAVYSGYVTSYYPDSTLKQKFGVINGKKQNEASDWYPDGRLKFLATYHRGKLHGEKKKWNPDSSHTLVSHLNYHKGKLHGVQKKWYASGQIFKILHMDMGQEKGIQQGFRKNGRLFANYEAKEGRVFGLKKATLCYGLEEEKILIRE